MTRLNFDLLIADSEQPCNARAEVKVRDVVEIDRSNPQQDIVVRTTNGVPLGTLPLGALDDYHAHVQFKACIRSVSRSTDTQNITRITVCLTPCKKKRDPDYIPRWERETLDEEWLLKTQQYEALVGSQEVRGLLSDKRLREILKAIDEAEEKETALHRAHEKSDEIRQLFTVMLDVIHGPDS